MSRRILITGGSGFIGTNFVSHCLESGFEPLSLDIREPQDASHTPFFRRVDILDSEALASELLHFRPRDILHLAARTDVEGKSIEDYKVNTKGVENLLWAIRQCETVRRCIFISTKLVVPNESAPSDERDFRPDTLYGESKAIGERIVRESRELSCSWCIARPTSIWGPWSGGPHNPYGRFFETLIKNRYFHLGSCNSPRRFGFVGNSVFQISRLFAEPAQRIHSRVFYLADYEMYTIRQWADEIALQLRGSTPFTMPEVLVRPLALCGDVLKTTGLMRHPPLTTFRWRNMQADTSLIPLAESEEITGPLPFTMREGVAQTLQWFGDRTV